MNDWFGNCYINGVISQCRWLPGSGGSLPGGSFRPTYTAIAFTGYDFNWDWWQVQPADLLEKVIYIADQLTNPDNYTFYFQSIEVPFSLAASHKSGPQQTGPANNNAQGRQQRVQDCLNAAMDQFQQNRTRALAQTNADLKPDVKWFAGFAVGRGLLALGGKFTWIAVPEALLLGLDSKGIVALANGASKDLQGAGTLQYRQRLCMQIK